MSWIGDKSVVAHFLLEVGADKDEERGFHLTEGFIVFGLGDKEAVIPDHVEYFINGQGHPLAEALLTLGQGVAIGMY